MATANCRESIYIADSATPASAKRETDMTAADAVMNLALELGGPRIVVAVTRIGRVTPALTAGEQMQFSRLGSKSRRESWLAGRAAIKAVRERLGLDTDTAGLCFPDACTSMTHAAGCAVAVGAPQGLLRGIGVDLEAWRSSAAGITRFFLTAAERDWIEALPPARQERERIRLWTVKEAVFKAWPGNRGMVLTQFVLDDPSASTGMATPQPQPTGRKADLNRVSYASKWTPAGCVSLAYFADAICAMQ